MKIQLLKRVRKEFSINHYPNGCVKPREGYLRTVILKRYGNDTFTLENSNGEILEHHDLSKEWVHHTYQEIYDDLYRKMMKMIVEKYAKYGTRRLKKEEVKQTPNKLWFN